jgi:hydrogenase maturation protease
MIPILDTDLVGEAASPASRGDASAPVLVLGVGNLLMGDEGVGVHAMRRMEAADPVPGVRLLDGGTGGAALLSEFDNVRAIVLIDATRDGSRAGATAYRYRRQWRVGDLPRGLSAHEFGLKDLFAASALIGSMPELHLITVAVETVRPMCTELSPEVEAAVPAVLDAARALASRLAGAY